MSKAALGGDGAIHELELRFAVFESGGKLSGAGANKFMSGESEFVLEEDEGVIEADGEEGNFIEGC